MPTFRTYFAAMAIAVLGVNTQTTAKTYTIDPNSVPISTRQNWCQSQIASCPLLCLQNTNSTDTSTVENTCDSETLNYSCLCGSGFAPDLSNFSQTIPFFECQEYGNQCVAACGNGQTSCQNNCRVDNPCGAQNPTRVNSTTSSTMPATATSTSTGGGAVYTGLGTDSKTSQKNGSQPAQDIGRHMGLVVLFAGLFAGFAFIL